MLRTKHLAFFLAALLAVVSLLHGAGTYFSWYWEYPWFDLAPHFLGGAWVAAASLWFLSILSPRALARMGGAGRAGMMFSAVLAAAVAWEVFEYSVGAVDVAKPSYLPDTITDMVAGFAGAGVVIAYFLQHES